MGINFSHGRSNSSSSIDNNNIQLDGDQDQESKTKEMGYDKPKNQTDPRSCTIFKIPLHYPRYTKSDYEKMPEWQLDQLLREYGLPIIGDSYQKRNFAIGAFLWSPDNQEEH